MRPSSLLVLTALVASGCVWRTSEPTPSQPAAQAEPEDGYEKVAPGVTRKIESTPDGDELVKINVDMDQAELEDPSLAEPPAILPRPFTAEQIRQAMPLGTEYVFGMSGERAGEATVTWNVSAHDEQGVTIAYEAQTPDGPQPTQTETLPWKQLEEHASFPQEFTTRTEGPITVKAGTFDAPIYTVTPPQARPPVVETFHFARSLPGPPVLHEVREGDTVVHRMELLSHQKGGPAE